jgi:hypothetical protein
MGEMAYLRPASGPTDASGGRGGRSASAAFPAIQARASVALRRSAAAQDPRGRRKFSTEFVREDAGSRLIQRRFLNGVIFHCATCAFNCLVQCSPWHQRVRRHDAAEPPRGDFIWEYRAGVAQWESGSFELTSKVRFLPPASASGDGARESARGRAAHVARSSCRSDQGTRQLGGVHIKPPGRGIATLPDASRRRQAVRSLQPAVSDKALP